VSCLAGRCQNPSSLDRRCQLPSFSLCQNFAKRRLLFGSEVVPKTSLIQHLASLGSFRGQTEPAVDYEGGEVETTYFGANSKTKVHACRFQRAASRHTQTSASANFEYSCLSFGFRECTDDRTGSLIGPPGGEVARSKLSHSIPKSERINSPMFLSA
jgi:hypothetical protein